MLSTTNNTTTELKRRRTLQGRHGRPSEQTWIERRATDIIHSLEKIPLSEEIAQRHEEHVCHQRQLTLDILEGRRPQATPFIVHGQKTLKFHTYEELFRALDNLEREYPEEVTRDEQTDSRKWSQALAILEGRHQTLKPIQGAVHTLKRKPAIMFFTEHTVHTLQRKPAVMFSTEHTVHTLKRKSAIMFTAEHVMVREKERLMRPSRAANTSLREKEVMRDEQNDSRDLSEALAILEGRRQLPPASVMKTFEARGGEAK
ncbi:hypothetical protein CPB85DRAFT_1258361 [Mucidula mucida]|nr:hypothetical protein CPB85DRAFT_1258361 [Mucidula mucida]